MKYLLYEPASAGCIVIALLLSAMTGNIVGAQSHATGSHVTLALVDSLPEATHTLVIRRRTQAPHQLVLIDDDATGQDIALALATLGALRARDGDSISVDVMARPRGQLLDVPQAHRISARWQGYFERLRTAPSEFVPGFGLVPAITVDIGPAPRIGP